MKTFELIYDDKQEVVAVKELNSDTITKTSSGHYVQRIPGSETTWPETKQLPSYSVVQLPQNNKGEVTYLNLIQEQLPTKNKIEIPIELFDKILKSVPKDQTLLDYLSKIFGK